MFLKNNHHSLPICFLFNYNEASICGIIEHPMFVLTQIWKYQSFCSLQIFYTTKVDSNI
uniref:Uncharacterized protein n=1 Tax=Arundo donax TaxID=35708 RepID=A0A0A9CVG1_ARUDO